MLAKVFRELGRSAALLLAISLLAGGIAEAATVQARVDLSSQTMQVRVDGVLRYSWPVSTARAGYRTPVGRFKAQRLHKRYFSKKYHNSPMPYSVFFYHGYAVHGTNDLKRLGRPASHGCVRLHPENARTLFSLINQNGKQNAEIVITR
ncbi:L,D-transpeptidase [Roseibium suaedae]|uniref:L,D-transpeptidase catalytic domain n=1 Tax=Roseibium suaedae TaxID=735517 RepID=A0A1M7N655_9HYPH|nr:L,D-transpeptidase [Roseibium suaedae]SHM98539.1 L,D-transpeptidase catalytic domain [Roseibium suaedae]